MILIYALIFIVFESVSEGFLKRFNKAEWLFENWLQLVTTCFLFSLWYIVFALPFDKYYVPNWKLIVGFIGVRFMIFDVIYNLSAGNKWNYYGTRKWYDRTMAKLGSWGWFMKLVCGIVGIVFLMGWN